VSTLSRVKLRTSVEETAHGVSFTDIYSGPSDRAAALTLAPERGRLRGSLPDQPTASGVLGARVESVTFRQNKAGRWELYIRYHELRPFQSAPTTLNEAPTKLNGTSTVNLNGNILDDGMAADVLVVGSNTYVISSITDENTCVVTGDASGEADEAECYVRSVTTGDLVEIAGSRRVVPGATMNTYVGLFVSLSLHEDTYAAGGTACPFDGQSGVAAAVQVTPAAISEDWAQGRHLYTIQYAAYLGTVAANVLTLTKGPEVALDTVRRQFTVLLVVTSTSDLPGIGDVYGAEAAADPLAARCVRLQRHEDQLPGRHVASVTYMGLTGSNGSTMTTLNGDPTKLNGTSTVVLAAAILDSGMVSLNLTMSGDAYAIVGYTNSTTCTVTGDPLGDGHGDGDDVEVPNSKWAFVTDQKSVNQPGENHWSVRSSYAILAADYAVFRLAYFGSRHGDYSGNFAPYCRRITRDHLGWGIRGVYKVDVYYWTILKPGKAMILPSGTVAGERVWQDTNGAELEEDDDGGAGVTTVRRITQGSKTVLKGRNAYDAIVSHSSGFQAAANAAEAMLGKVNDDTCAAIGSASAGDLLCVGYSLEWLGPWGSQILYIHHKLLKHPVGWNSFTKSRRFTRTQVAIGGPWALVDASNEKTHPLYATTSMKEELSDRVIWPT